jgi:hypothetical protein
MSNNFKNIALGLLALVVSGGLVVAGYLFYTNQEIGRYVPIPPTENSAGLSILDTKTGVFYHTYIDANGYRVYYTKVNPISPDFKRAFTTIPRFKGKKYE